MGGQLVLVTGANGQLGRELARTAFPAGWQVVALDRESLDLADPGAIATMIGNGHDGRKWGVVINAGAYTAVDAAERDQVAAWTVNTLAPAALGAACALADIPLVHVSTDYVFDGNRPGARGPDDPVGPLGVYGASKLGGELAVRTSGARHVIVRTAWVFSAHGNNFVKTMLRIASGRDVLSVVDDQHGCPTSAGDLAKALAKIAVRLVEDGDAPVGTFHFANRGETTWAAFAREIFRRSAGRGGPSATVTPISSAEYPTAAMRPANSVLDTGSLQEAYGIVPRPWGEALDDVLEECLTDYPTTDVGH